MVEHHLRHGRSHATCRAMRVTINVILAIYILIITLSIVRSHVVVGLDLVPCRGNQFVNIGFLCAGASYGFVSGGRGNGAVVLVLLEPSDLVCIALKPSTHVAGHVVGVDATAVAEAEDGRGLVIVRYDDVAAVVAHVEYVEATHFYRLFHCWSCSSATMALHEFQGNLLCLFWRYFVGPSACEAADHQCQ